MHMNSDQNPFNVIVYDKARGPSYSVQIKGTVHPNYTDLSIFSGLFRKIGLMGSIDGFRMLEIESDYVLAFFDKHLKGESVPLLDGPSSRYPEVIFKSANLVQ